MYERENIERSIYYNDLSWGDGNYVYTIATHHKDNNHYCKKLWNVLCDLSWIRTEIKI